MTEEYIVVGGGVVGSCTALALKRKGYNVTILEQFYIGHIRGSSHGPSRIIRYLYEHERYQKFMPNAYKLWHQIEKEEDVELYNKCGIMNISEIERVPHFTSILEKNNHSYTTYTAEEASKTFPVTFNESEGAIIEHKGGVLDANLCVRSAINVFTKLGGNFVSGIKIQNIENQDGKVKLTATNGKIFLADKVVLACGSWMKNLLAKTGLDLPLTPIRVDVPYWSIKPEFKDRYSIDKFPAGIYDKLDASGDSVHYYWTPVKEYDNMIKIAYHGSSGGLIDPDSRDDPSVQNPEKAAEMLAHQRKELGKMFPGIDTENGPAINEHCIYTLTPDADFILDHHPYFENVVIAAGFSGHGFKMAPEVGRTLANMISGEEVEYDMSPFSIRRFDK